MSDQDGPEEVEQPDEAEHEAYVKDLMDNHGYSRQRAEVFWISVQERKTTQNRVASRAAATEAASAAEVKRASAALGWVVAAFFVILVGGCSVLLHQGSSGGGSGGSGSGDDGGSDGRAVNYAKLDDAKRVCRDQVKDRLKAPSTAKFSGQRADSDGTTYIVSGNVDSQNGFGAMLRSTYGCTMTDSGSIWSEIVVDLNDGGAIP